MRTSLSTIPAAPAGDSTSPRRPKHNPYSVALLLALVLTPTVSRAATDTQSMPAVRIEISDDDLFEKSLRAAGEALLHYGASDDRDELLRVADIGYALAMAADFRDYPFTFFLVDMPEPNAFALPGGQIFVTRGMLKLGLDDDMLASLLGHELAHVIHRHGTRMQKRATLLNILSQALLVGVVIGVDDSSPPPVNPYGTGRSDSRKGSLVQGTAATGMVISELLLRNYSREFEDEADVEGQRLAAASGFDPLGGERLWELMNQRIPQSETYGYWRTHPFARLRMRAARVRGGDLKIQERDSAEQYRIATQNTLLQFAQKAAEKRPSDQTPEQPDDSLRRTSKEAERKTLDLPRFARQAALTAWPVGSQAESIRLDELHYLRDALVAKTELERNYGELIAAYREQNDIVKRLSPDSALLANLAAELQELERQSHSIYPSAKTVWEEGVYQTAFLSTYSSNYPDAPEAGEVALRLGEAYSRTGRQTEAVEYYLDAHAIEAYRDEALRGLHALAPRLDELTALQRLHEEVDDESLATLAGSRLEAVSSSFKKLENGASFLRTYPDSPLAGQVRDRLEELAQNLYGEVVLLQSIGDHLQALQRIQEILTHAPFSKAAENLREKAVLDG